MGESMVPNRSRYFPYKNEIGGILYTSFRSLTMLLVDTHPASKSCGLGIHHCRYAAQSRCVETSSSRQTPVVVLLL